MELPDLLLGKWQILDILSSSELVLHVWSGGNGCISSKLLPIPNTSSKMNNNNNSNNKVKDGKGKSALPSESTLKYSPVEDHGVKLKGD